MIRMKNHVPGQCIKHYFIKNQVSFASPRAICRQRSVNITGTHDGSLLQC